MTITSNILRRDYTANGVNTSYAFDFPIFYESNATPKFSLEVIVADTTGAETTKIETTDYTITYNTTDYVNGVINQGNVVFNTAPANNYTISLLRKVNFTQNNDITTSGSDALPGTALEGSLDKLTLMLLEQKESLNRVFKLPKSSLLDNIEFPIGASQANQVITVNNAGDNLTTKDLADVGLAPVSTFAKTLLDDTTASQARTTLDAQQLNANLTFLANLPSAKATTTTQGVSYLNNPITIANNATDANNDIDFSAGNFQFNDGSGQALATAITKRLDATWSAGTGNGGLFNGTAVPKAVNSTYHCYKIYNPTTGAEDSGFLLGILGTAPNPTSVLPSGYTKFKRVGSILIDGSGNIRAFTQFGNYFKYATGISDLNGSFVAGSTTPQVSTPLGINALGIFNIGLDISSVSTGNNIWSVISDFNQTSNLGIVSHRQSSVTVTKIPSFINIASGSAFAFTNLSSQIRISNNEGVPATTLAGMSLLTHGFIDINLNS
jgi:hypothetical protein